MGTITTINGVNGIEYFSKALKLAETKISTHYIVPPKQLCARWNTLDVKSLTWPSQINVLQITRESV